MFTLVSTRAALAVLVLSSAAVAQTNSETKSGGGPKRPQPVASEVGVYRGKSEMDNKRWTILVVGAKRAYRSSSGRAVWPELRVECVQDGDKHEAAVILNAGGPLEGVDYEGSTPSIFIAVKMDNALKERHIWRELSDRSSYKYMWPYPYDQEKVDAMQTDQLEEQHLVFLKEILAAKTVFVKIEPLLVTGWSEIPFDVRGVQKAFAKYPECRNAIAGASR